MAGASHVDMIPLQAPEPLPLPPSEPLNSPTNPGWGPWATLGFGAIIMLVFAFGQLVPVGLGLVLHSWWNPEGSSNSIQQVAMDGDVLGASTIAGGCLAMILIAGLAAAGGTTAVGYLNLRAFPWWQLPLWLVATFLAGMVQTTLAPIFNREPIPQFMVDTYQSTDHPLLLAAGIAVVAPLFEECFFRGFLYTGWRRSRFGVIPSVLMTTLLWTLIHLQYGWFDKSWIFGFGLLLCLAREWSGSLWPPIAMHVMNNVLSLIATAMELGGNTPSALGH